MESQKKKYDSLFEDRNSSFISPKTHIKANDSFHHQKLRSPSNRIVVSQLISPKQNQKTVVDTLGLDVLTRIKEAEHKFLKQKMSVNVISNSTQASMEMESARESHLPKLKESKRGSNPRANLVAM